MINERFFRERPAPIVHNKQIRSINYMYGLYEDKFVGVPIIYGNQVFCPAAKEACIQCPKISKRLLDSLNCDVSYEEAARLLQPFKWVKIKQTLFKRHDIIIARGHKKTYRLKVPKESDISIYIIDRFGKKVIAGFSGLSYRSLFLVRTEDLILAIGDESISYTKAKKVHYMTAYETADGNIVSRTFRSLQDRYKHIKNALDKVEGLYINAERFSNLVHIDAALTMPGVITHPLMTATYVEIRYRHIEKCKWLANIIGWYHDGIHGPKIRNVIVPVRSVRPISV